MRDRAETDAFSSPGFLTAIESTLRSSRPREAPDLPKIDENFYFTRFSNLGAEKPCARIFSSNAVSSFTLSGCSPPTSIF